MYAALRRLRLSRRYGSFVLGPVSSTVLTSVIFMALPWSSLAGRHDGGAGRGSAGRRCVHRTSRDATFTARSWFHPVMTSPWPVRFVLLAAIWGMSFVFIRLGVESFEPLQVAFGRLALGAITLSTILLLRHERLPRARRTWGHLVVAAFFMNAAPFTLFAYGEQRVPSALAGIWNATTPLLALPVVVALLPDERVTSWRLGGLFIGFFGVLTVLGAWTGAVASDGGTDLVGDAMCIAAAGCYAIGYPYARRFLSSTGHTPVVLSTSQILVAVVEVGIVTVLFTRPPTEVQPQSVAAVIALGVLGTGIAYILNYSLLRDAGATITTTVTYLLPIVAVIAGVVLLDEPLTWNEPLGAAIIIGGAVLAQGRPSWFGRRSRSTADPERPPDADTMAA